MNINPNMVFTMIYFKQTKSCTEYSSDFFSVYFLLRFQSKINRIFKPHVRKYSAYIMNQIFHVERLNSVIYYIKGHRLFFPPTAKLERDFGGINM